ncbi:hypothetical protein AAFC00_006305 [Neodothiora populina]|uniref:Altered inheritance of mitochondria protein 6 n=1 Tax=Neodothiora populina TaxID=2781224 RepID=A0ABR3P528_9PEZI
MVVVSSIVLAAALVVYEVYAKSDVSSSASPQLSQPLQQILSNAANSSLYQYPTRLTQGIIPKFFHSHNDYWRPVPFYSALSVGGVSVEADVWYDPAKSNDTLYVGHEISALTTTRTLDSLYIQPILSVLHSLNPNTTFVPRTTHNGVFDTNSAQTLYLWIDVKTDGATTWPQVIKALAPLREGGWLTTFNGTSVTPGAVTVIGTGNTPLNQVQGVGNASHPRDFFWDAPLAALNTTASNITADVSPIASTDFATQFGEVRNESFNATQLALLRAQIAAASSKNIGVRYWDQPGWPISTRDAIWRTLWDEGVTLLNVDDLEAAAEF